MSGSVVGSARVAARVALLLVHVASWDAVVSHPSWDAGPSSVLARMLMEG